MSGEYQTSALLGKNKVKREHLFHSQATTRSLAKWDKISVRQRVVVP